MKIEVQKITSLEDAHEAIEFTSRNLKAKCPLDSLYKWEHSPSRTQLFKVKMYDIFSFVSVHFVRHSAVGQQHYVTSNRDDRGGEGNIEVNRLSLVNHLMILNAQHLIDMSKKRLCFKASPETKEVMELIKGYVGILDPDLSKYMVPNCVYKGGYCSEPKPCGNYNVKIYNPNDIMKLLQAKEE